MWELERHMHSYIAPSILKYAEEQTDPLGWLCQRAADLVWEDGGDAPDYDTITATIRADYVDAEDKPIYWGPLIECLTEAAIDYGCTTNGGCEVYLDDWTSVPFCSEDDMLEYYS